MQDTTPSLSRDLDHELDQVRDQMVNRIWSGICLLAVLGVPISISRTFSTGWLPLYGVHLLLGGIALATYWNRRRIATHIKSHIAIALFWAVGLMGLKALGLLGAGTWWLVTSALLISVLYSERAGLVAIAGVCVVVALFGVAYSSGFLALAFDANAYITEPASWATLLIATVVLPLVVFSAVSNLSHTVVDLSRELDRQREENERLAKIDELTGIPRSAMAMDRLEQALIRVPRQGRKVAVLFIDLDGFKQVNDRYGHDAGDMVLRTVSQRCTRTLRIDDTIARQGGDEFIVILQGLAIMEQAVDVAEKLIQTIAVPMRYADAELQIGASIGVAVSPDHAQDAKSLIAAADAAMYSAKRKGKNRCALATRSHALRVVSSQSA